MTGPGEELIAAGYAWETADASVLHDALNLADLAHAVELADRGVVPAESARKLIGALLDMSAVDYDPRHGELYDSRERHLTARIGADAGWLRAGRTRREAVRIALRITLRAQLLDLVAGAAGLATALADQAERHVDTLMPDYTYLQQAQPTTFGHYLLSFADPVLRDADRLLAELGHVNGSPAGSGAANGSPILADREGSARALGFDRAITHTRDAMWQTDPFLHLLTTATSLVLTQDKLAEDLEIFTSAEFDFVDLADAYTRPSILMPQKRNPYALTVVRGSAGVLLGRLAGQAAVAKTPSARSDNLIYVYGELPRAIDLAARVTRLSAAVVRTLAARPERMRAALDSGVTAAADLADLLMRRFAVDYRTAHRVVARAVRAGLDADSLAKAASDVTGQDWRIDATELAVALDPATLVRSRTALGGAAPSAMGPMVAGVRAAAEELERRVERSRRRIAAAETAVRERAHELGRIG
ncbi:argininosuccinate lyase [Asanoa hainanensis]|uniref:argininosuccinate lyase n=1 Tax=Asanoa hainanensis TaxID=560556 RepID=A0A239GPZ7_9ACTN|nr:argininosuccinate lyase [Asanoa hainanensis]SNS71207.1 argininosuccinate lyase [Asanoa hainanensis]